MTKNANTTEVRNETPSIISMNSFSDLDFQ